MSLGDGHLIVQRGTSGGAQGLPGDRQGAVVALGRGRRGRLKLGDPRISSENAGKNHGTLGRSMGFSMAEWDLLLFFFF